MSDDARKDFSTKAKEALTPDATKSDATKIKEATTDSLDRTAREAQPDHTKSNVQEGIDKSQRAKDNTQHGSTHQTTGEKVKDALGMGHHDTTTTHHH